MLLGFRVAVEMLGTVWIDMVCFYGFALLISLTSSSLISSLDVFAFYLLST
jgi:hypothetical protein